MDKKLLAQASKIIDSSTAQVKKQLAKFLKTKFDRPSSVMIEVQPDQYGLSARVYFEEGSPESIDIYEDVEEYPLSKLSRFLETIPEPKTKAGYQELEELHTEAHKIILKSLSEIWKELEGGKKIPLAYAQFEDDAQALDLAKGKSIDTDELELEEWDQLSPTTPSELPYDPIPENEAAEIPHFFADETLEWNEKQVADESAKVYAYMKEHFAQAETLLTNAVKTFMKETAAPKDAIFIDLDVDFGDPLRLRYTVVTSKVREAPTFQEGKEIFLGRRNAFEMLSTIYSRMSTILMTSSFGMGIFDPIQVQYDQTTRVMVQNVWKKCSCNGWTMPGFVRHLYSGHWIDPRDAEKTLEFKAAKAFAK